jgi:hypothetical protein
MSINSITNDELRRWHSSQQQPVSKGLELAAPNEASARRIATEMSIQDNQVAVTLNALVKYIPTEIVTLYVAASSTTQSLRTAMPYIDARMLYWGFTALTPVLLILMYASKRATDGLPVFPKAREMPWWKLTAATVAFMVWALAVPGNPYVVGDGAPIIASFGAIIISTLLSLLEPIFERPLPVATQQPDPLPSVPPATTPQQPTPQLPPSKPPLTPPGGAG